MKPIFTDLDEMKKKDQRKALLREIKKICKEMKMPRSYDVARQVECLVEQLQEARSAADVNAFEVERLNSIFDKTFASAREMRKENQEELFNLRKVMREAIEQLHDNHDADSVDRVRRMMADALEGVQEDVEGKSDELKETRE